MALSYEFSIGSVRAREKMLLGKAEIEQLLSMKNESEIITFLKDKGYPDGETVTEILDLAEGFPPVGETDNCPTGKKRSQEKQNHNSRDKLQTKWNKILLHQIRKPFRNRCCGEFFDTIGHGCKGGGVLYRFRHLGGKRVVFHIYNYFRVQRYG